MTISPVPATNPLPPSPRRRGAPLGNHNARKARPLDSRLLWKVVDVRNQTQGCAEEIAMLRLRIKVMFMRHVPDDEFLRACDVLNRLLQTHYRIMATEAGPPAQH